MKDRSTLDGLFVRDIIRRSQSRVVIADDTDDIEVRNTTSETRLSDATIPGGELTSGDIIRFTAAFETFDIVSSGADQLTLRVKYGGQTVGTATISNDSNADITGNGLEITGVIIGTDDDNQDGNMTVSSGSASIVSGNVQSGFSDTVAMSGTVDATQERTLEITAQFNGADPDSGLNHINTIYELGRSRL